MRLSERKLTAIEQALRHALDTIWNYDREATLEALHWAQEQTRRRAKGKRSYVGAHMKGRPK